MQKQQLYQTILSQVSHMVGLVPDSILHSTTEECTDARYLLICILHRVGFTDVEIASRIGRTRQAVAHLRTCYKRTGKWLLSNQWQTLVKWVENEVFESK